MNNENHIDHVGICSIIGQPNTGKSTLLNQILNTHLVAVSPKPHTTRNRIMGIKNITSDQADYNAQIVFVDTPGIQIGRGALRAYMSNEAVTAAGDCDLMLFIVDASKKTALDDLLNLSAVKHTNVPAIIALNKVDKVSNKKNMLPFMETCSKSGRFQEIIPISGLTGNGVDILLHCIAKTLPQGHRLFPTDMVTDRSELFLISEMVREQIYLQLEDELPYASAVVVNEIEEYKTKDDIIIRAVIYVESESQKSIVIGKKGQRIKEIGTKARKIIGTMLQCESHIDLVVRVSHSWSHNNQGLRRMGYT